MESRPVDLCTTVAQAKSKRNCDKCKRKATVLLNTPGSWQKRKTPHTNSSTGVLLFEKKKTKITMDVHTTQQVNFLKYIFY